MLTNVFYLYLKIWNEHFINIYIILSLNLVFTIYYSYRNIELYYIIN